MEEKGSGAMLVRRSCCASQTSFLAGLNEGIGEELLWAYLQDRSESNRNALGMHYALCAQVVARQVYRGLTAESRRQVEVEDLEQEGMRLVFELVGRFDPDLGVPLSAFLTRRVRFGLIDWCRGEGLMVRAGRELRARRVGMPRGLADRGRSPAERLMDEEAERLLFRAFGAHKTGAKPRITRVSRSQKQREHSALPADWGVLPVDLRRQKEFRRLAIRRVPWAYRKLVAWRYLRGRDIEWTAGRLGIAAEKARVMDRAARPLVVRVVEEFRKVGC